MKIFFSQLHNNIFLVELLCPEKNGPVVQLNRTSDSGSESRGFESRRGHNEEIDTSFYAVAGVAAACFGDARCCKRSYWYFDLSGDGCQFPDQHALGTVGYPIAFVCCSRATRDAYLLSWIPTGILPTGVRRAEVVLRFGWSGGNVSTGASE